MTISSTPNPAARGVLVGLFELLPPRRRVCAYYVTLAAAFALGLGFLVVLYLAPGTTAAGSAVAGVVAAVQKRLSR